MVRMEEERCGCNSLLRRRDGNAELYQHQSGQSQPAGTQGTAAGTRGGGMFAEDRQKTLVYQRDGQQIRHLFNAAYFFAQNGRKYDGGWDAEDVRYKG